ncbi:MAG: PE-PGRS family protein [Deltaproteobacteria bacterium]|nr:PE-PGRS family protein [Deltaproteobacteria bacterium]
MAAKRVDRLRRAARLLGVLLAAAAAKGCSGPGSASSDGGADGRPASVDARVGFDLAPPDGASASACPRFDPGRVSGTVGAAQLTEASGLVASRRTPGLLWLHNDSGDGPNLYAVSASGVHQGTFALEGATAVDWEDLAAGPGPEAGRSYLYVGDIGDNAEAREHVVVYRVAEPEVKVGTIPEVTTLGGVERFEFTYPAGKATNAESLFVDPGSGDLYVLAKRSQGPSPLYRARAPLSAGTRRELEQVAEVDLAALGGDALATGADLSPSGEELLVRSYTRLWLFRRAKGRSVAEALASPPCAVPVLRELQGEAVGFAADGQGYFTVSEGAAPELHFHARQR